MLSTAIIRKTIPPDLIVTPQNVPVGDPVIFIPFYYLDKRTGGTDNNANMIALPARFIAKELALEIVQKFLETDFEGGRHQNRVEKIAFC